MSTTPRVPPDRVLVRDEGVERQLAITEFVALPLTQRVRYLLAGQAEFFHGSARLDTAEALRSLFEQSANKMRTGGSSSAR